MMLHEIDCGIREISELGYTDTKIAKRSDREQCGYMKRICGTVMWRSLIGWHNATSHDEWQHRSDNESG